MLPFITDGLVNQLDASALITVFADGQSLILASVPDQVDSKGWLGDGYDISYSLSGAPNGAPSFVFKQGFLKQLNWDSFLKYDSMTVMIAATRTGNSWTGNWMGLYSMFYNGAKAGINILAVTDNNLNKDFSHWGTYKYVTTASTSAMDLNTSFVISVVGNKDSSGTFYTNTSATGDFPASKAQGYFGVGGMESSRGFFVGNVYELLVYNRALTASEISTNASYLYDKWNLTHFNWNDITYTWDETTSTWDAT
jgi:hypothetical protein